MPGFVEACLLLLPWICGVTRLHTDTQVEKERTCKMTLSGIGGCSLILYQNLASGGFSKVSCGVESETMSVCPSTVTLKSIGHSRAS